MPFFSLQLGLAETFWKLFGRETLDWIVLRINDVFTSKHSRTSGRGRAPKPTSVEEVKALIRMIVSAIGHTAQRPATMEEWLDQGRDSGRVGFVGKEGADEGEKGKTTMPAEPTRILRERAQPQQKRKAEKRPRPGDGEDDSGDDFVPSHRAQHSLAVSPSSVSAPKPADNCDFIRRTRWDRLMGAFAGIDPERLETLFDFVGTSFRAFWLTPGVVKMCLDESIMGFTGNYKTITIPRKPTPTGILCYVVCALSAFGHPVPLFFVPRLRDNVYPRSALEQTVDFIKGEQNAHKLPEQTIVTCDAAFTNIPLFIENYPAIRFLAGSSSNDISQLLGFGLQHHESRSLLRGPVLMSVWQDNAPVFNVSTLFATKEAAVPAPNGLFKAVTLALFQQMEPGELQIVARLMGYSTAGGPAAIIERINGKKPDEIPSPVKRRAAKTEPITQPALLFVTGDDSEETQQTKRDEQHQAIKAMTLEEIREQLSSYGVSKSGNKAECVRRLCAIKFGDQALSIRTKAFLALRTHLSNGTPAIQLYRKLFNWIDRLDTLLSYIDFPWTLKHGNLVVLVWIVRTAMISAYAAVSTNNFLFTGLSTKYPNELKHVTTFAMALAEALKAEEHKMQL